MFLGILIGMVIYGLLLMATNTDDPRYIQSVRAQRAFVRIFAMGVFILGASGAVGWCLEVFL